MNRENSPIPTTPISQEALEQLFALIDEGRPLPEIRAAFPGQGKQVKAYLELVSRINGLKEIIRPDERPLESLLKPAPARRFDALSQVAEVVSLKKPLISKSFFRNHTWSLAVSACVVILALGGFILFKKSALPAYDAGAGVSDATGSVDDLTATLDADSQAESQILDGEDSQAIADLSAATSSDQSITTYDQSQL